MKVVRYTPKKKKEWNDFAHASKNGTFLHLRDYMDYHSDRFRDHSLLFVDGNDKLAALLPANEEDGTLISHGGLTYGGVITGAQMTASRMLEAFDALVAYARKAGISRVVYKTIPSLYHKLPADEDRYALFRHKAALNRCDVLSVVDQRQRLPYQERRTRKIKQARGASLAIEESRDFAAFWRVLEQNLSTRHGKKPVHSCAEIELLAGRFPDHIRLHICRDAEEVLAGVVIYDTGLAAHAQYIAASERGKQLGALDLVFAELLEVVYVEHRYFDFGISTEQNGQHLNIGLVEQKEGFGARTLVHDHYELVIP